MVTLDFRVRASYDISRIKAKLSRLTRKLQRNKHIVKIAIPPSGVMAVTRSTGYTVYLTERPLPPLIPPLVHPRNDPPPQAPQRRAGGTTRNDSELEPTDTVNPSHLAFPRWAPADPRLKTRSTKVPSAGRPSVRRGSIQTRYNHSHRGPPQIVPDDSLAALKGGPRPANAEGHGGLQYDTRRDFILLTWPTRPAPTASNKSTPPSTTAPSPTSNLAPSSRFNLSPSPPFSLNSEADHMQQMGGGPLSTGSSRRPFPSPTSLDSGAGEGPPVPLKDLPDIIPPSPVATSNVDKHGVDQQRSGETTSANSANEQISRPTVPGPHENLSPAPALNAACLPFAERPPPYHKTAEPERCWLDDADLTDGYYFVRRFLGKIGVSQGESDPTAPQSTPPDLGAVIYLTKMQNGHLRLPTPPSPATIPSDPLLPPDGPPPQPPQRRAGGTAHNDSELESTDTMNPGHWAFPIPGGRASPDSHLKTRSTEVPLASSPSVRRKSIQSRYNHSHRVRKGGPRAANAEGNGGPQYDTRRDSILATRPTGPSPAASALPSNGGSAGVFSYFNNENDHRQQMGGGCESPGGFRPPPPPAPTNLDSDIDQGPPPPVPPKDPPKVIPPPRLATSNVDEPEPIEPDGPPAYSRVDVLPNGGYINVSEFGILIFERSVR